MLKKKKDDTTDRKKEPKRIVGMVTLQQHKITRIYYLGGYSLARNANSRVTEYLDKEIAVMALVDGKKILRIQTVEFPVVKTAEAEPKKKKKKKKKEDDPNKK